MPFVPDALLSEGLKGVVPGMDDAASALAADYRGRCLEVMSRGEGGETLLFPSVDGHFMCMTRT